jgi:hypothetical protein
MNDNLNQLESDLLARIKANGQINIRTLNTDDLIACMTLHFKHDLITAKKTRRGNPSKRFVVIKNQ